MMAIKSQQNIAIKRNDKSSWFYVEFTQILFEAKTKT